jgi:ABC-type dipeptide/oligopeptide/nickel transport system permease component
MALNLMIALMVILGSLLSDFLYSIADPRVRYGS